MSLLLERERELDRLAGRLDAAGRGEGGLIVVQGAPGLGKTSVMRAAVVEAQRRGFAVARARGAELEREWPFGIARQLFEPAVRACSADERARLLEGAAGLAAHVVLPERPGGTRAVDAGFGTLHGLYWLCANLATRRPLLLVVDDAQWADESSLRFLGVLARRLDALALLVLLAQRPAPPDALAQLAADPQTELLGLRPLSAAAIERLLAAWAPAGVDAPFARACEAATGGNPFLLSRLAQDLRQRGVAFSAANAERVTSAGGEAVRDAVSATLTRLAPRAVALAEAIAVLGDDVEPALAAQLAGLDEGAADAAGEQLSRAAILEDARPLRFVHAIVRDAVAARLAAGVRGTMHADAAELLAARHAAPDAVAGHLLAAEPRGRPWVVERLMSAARQALAQGAPETALRQLERALAEPPATAAVRAEVLLHLARAERRLGRPDALEHLRDAYALAPAPGLRSRAALELIWQGGPTLDVAELVALLEQAISGVEDDRELRLELEGARFAAIQPRARAGTATAGELRRWASLEGDTPAERLLLAQLAVAQMNAGGPATEAAEFAERAARGPGFERTGRGGLSLMLALWVLVRTDRLEAAGSMLERELQAARQRGSLAAFQLACFYRGVVALRRGSLAEAEADLRAGLDAVPPHVWRRRQVVAYLLDVLVQTGDLAGAQALLTAGDWNTALPDDEDSNLLLASRAGLRCAQGDIRRAMDDALEARRRRVRDGSLEDVDWDGRSRIALLYHRLGERDAARREADAQLITARRWNTPGAIGQALRISALTQEGEHGARLLQDAVEHLARSPACLEHARALIDHGAALRRRGDRTAARDPLRLGLDLAAARGAHPLAEHARAELAATGIRIRRDAQTGIAALTPSERRIIEHAASGATNPQIAQALFITVKTVEMHLHNAYRKLDITSRHQLPRHLPATTPQPPRRGAATADGSDRSHTSHRSG